jgi:hypothetical protein
MRPNAPALLADGIHPSFPPYRAYFAAVSESAQRKRSSSSSSRSRGRVARRACTGEYVCDRSRPCKQKNNADAGQRSGDVDERKITDRVFVSEGPAARAGYRADTVARGAVTLASVSAVAVDVRGSLEGVSCLGVCSTSVTKLVYTVLRGDVPDYRSGTLVLYCGGGGI